MHDKKGNICRLVHFYTLFGRLVIKRKTQSSTFSFQFYWINFICPPLGYIAIS